MGPATEAQQSDLEKWMCVVFASKAEPLFTVSFYYSVRARPLCFAVTPGISRGTKDGSHSRVVSNAEGSSCRPALLEWITKEED